MTDYSRFASDVRRWPNDPAARQALEDYFSALPQDPKIVIPSLDGSGLDFTGADLSGLEFLGAEFNNANLSGVQLIDANLGGASLLSATLRNADVSYSSLRKAQARGCNAQEVVAVNADLRSADFAQANLSQANLRGARLGRAWMPHTDLRGTDLSACNFGQDQAWASLREARLAGCVLDGAYGSLAGPVDIGADFPRLLDGTELSQWFADHGASQIEIRDPIKQ
jgi:uncharacterized protein YjbI with pentapeptide repeats